MDRFGSIMPPAGILSSYVTPQSNDIPQSTAGIAGENSFTAMPPAINIDIHPANVADYYAAKGWTRCRPRRDNGVINIPL